MLTFTAFAAGSGAAAQDRALVAPAATPAPAPADPVNLLAPPAAAQTAAVAPDLAAPEAPAATLAALVSTQAVPEELPSQIKCLAGAIYFEARSESLAGQLAVGRVVVARTKSGRFPASYCGVVYQTSQFSFVRDHAMPAVNTASHQWHNAVAVAQIADAGSWKSPAEGALFFHAARISPRWRMHRMAQVENHIFYR